MMPGAASYGGYKAESSESRALRSFSSDSFDYRDQGRNLIQLNNAVGYISGMMRKQQTAIDKANQNFVQQLQGLVTDLIVMFGGGGDTGLDWGDLKYVFQMFGALFGLADENGNLTVPVNPINAAWHFFSNYIGGTANFRELIDQLIDNAIATVLDIFGEVPIAGEALQQFASVVSDLRDLALPVIDATQALFDALDIDLSNIQGISDLFGPFKPVIEAIYEALDGIDLPDFSEALRALIQIGKPLIDLLAKGILVVAAFIKMITGQGTMADFGQAIADMSLIIDPTANGGAGLGFADIGQGLVQTVLAGLIGGADWGELFTELSGAVAGDNPLTDLGNLFKSKLNGAIDPSRLSSVPLTALGNFAQNMLDNPSFVDANAIINPLSFNYNATDGHAALGCATVIADGTLKTLVSNKMPTDPGQTLNLGGWAKWVGLVTSAPNPIKINILTFNGNALLGRTAVLSQGTTGTSSVNAGHNNFVQGVLSFVVPANTTHVQMELQVLPAATAGTISFDDGLVSPTRLLQLDWISGLLGYLSKLNPLGFLDASALTNMPAMPQIPDLLNKAPDFAGLVDKATSAFSGATQVGQEIVGAGLDVAQDQMSNIFAMIAKATRDIQDLQAEATSASTGGRSFKVNFGSYPDGPFPAGLFNVTYSGPGTSSLGISGGKAIWNLVNNGNRTAVLQFPTPTLTDFQFLRGTMASPPENNSSGQKPRIWALGRMSADGLNYVFARGYCTGFLSYKGDLGCVINGVEYIWAAGISLTWSLDMRVQVGVGINARRYLVFSGDTIVYDYTETAGQPGGFSNLGANYRYWGSRSDTNGVNTPGAVQGASVVDNAPPAVVGTSIRISRRLGADVTIAANGAKVPNNFYETIDYITPDLTYTPGNNCAVTVSKQGTYIAMWRCFHGQFATGTAGMGLLWKNNAFYARGPMDECPFNVGFGVMSTPTDSTFGCAIVALNPGDVVHPGFAFTNSMSNTGDTATLADGSRSWFALCRVGI